jgi:hypothetical protein
VQLLKGVKLRLADAVRTTEVEDLRRLPGARLGGPPLGENGVDALLRFMRSP